MREIIIHKHLARKEFMRTLKFTETIAPGLGPNDYSALRLRNNALAWLQDLIAIVAVELDGAKLHLSIF